MKSKKVIIFFIIVFGVCLILFTSIFIYLRNINIYEPFFIKITGVNTQEAKSVKIISISPLNREQLVPYDELNNLWWVNEYYYHKSINLTINDTLLKKVKEITLNFRYSKKVLKTKDLVLLFKGKTGSVYLLSNKIRDCGSNEKLVTKMIFRYANEIKISAISFLFIIIFLFNKKNIKSKLKKIFLTYPRLLQWLKTISFSVIIANSIFFGYLLFVRNVTSYYTSMSFILVAGIFFLCSTIIIKKVIGISEKKSQKIKKIILIVLFIWLFIENILRCLGINMGYDEKITNYYSSGFVNSIVTDKKNPHLIVKEKYSSAVLNRKDYAYLMKYNAEGLRDVDHPVQKDSNELRIICLGNSFTEGAGAPQDSTWPKLFETKLSNVEKRKVTVFNAGVSGADPFFEYMLLNERMLKYKPDIVMLALGSTDFNFYRFRGGFERFTPSGFHYRQEPAWGKLYAISHLFRYFLNNILLYKDLLSPIDYKIDSIKAKRDIEGCIRQFYHLSLKNNFKLIVIFIDDNYGDRYIPVINKMKKENVIPIINLFEYNSSIEKLTPFSRRNYYWPNDGHCNSKGYDLFSKGILWNLDRMGIIDSMKKE